MSCLPCFDSLETAIKQTEYVDNVKRIEEKAMITFSIPSSKIINEDRLKKMVKAAGLQPIKIEFLKEQQDDHPVEKVF